MASGKANRGKPPSTAGKHPARPVWNAKEQTLYVDGLVVKRFRQPAANQMLILDAFQEQGWPECIDNPLIRSGTTTAQRRLHDAITQLNRNQVNHLIRFGGDGTGKGIRWEWVDKDDA